MLNVRRTFLGFKKFIGIIVNEILCELLFLQLSYVYEDKEGILNHQIIT